MIHPLSFGKVFECGVSLVKQFFVPAQVKEIGRKRLRKRVVDEAPSPFGAFVHLVGFFRKDENQRQTAHMVADAFDHRTIPTEFLFFFG